MWLAVFGSFAELKITQKFEIKYNKIKFWKKTLKVTNRFQICINWYPRLSSEHHFKWSVIS